MTSAQVAYWSSMTQLLPLLGLGLIVEGRRALTANKRMEVNAFFQVVQAFVILISGIGCGLGVIAAAAALRENDAPVEWFGDLLEVCISGAVGAIIIGPLFEVVTRANAATVGDVIGRQPKVWLAYRRLRYRAASTARRRAAIRGDLGRVLEEMERMLRETDWMIDGVASIPGPLPQEVQAFLDKGPKIRSRMARQVDDVRSKFRHSIVDELNSRKYYNFAYGRIKEGFERDRQNTRSQIAQFLGGNEDVNRASHYLVPDDGGFLTNVAPPSISMDHIPPGHIVRDVREFYVTEDQRLT